MLNYFKVKFRSRCNKCMDAIEEGDYAAYSKEEPGQLLCRNCGKEEDTNDSDA